MRSVLVAVMVAVIVAFAPAHAAAFCGVAGLVVKVITPRAAIPSDGGVVAIAASEGSKHEAGDVAVQPSWRFRTGKRSLVPVIDRVAPGLTVYRLPTGIEAVELEDGDQAVIARARRDPQSRTRLAAPAVLRVVHAKVRESWSELALVVVELDALPRPGRGAPRSRPRRWRSIRSSAASRCRTAPCHRHPAIA